MIFFIFQAIPLLLFALFAYGIFAAVRRRKGKKEGGNYTFEQKMRALGELFLLLSLFLFGVTLFTANIRLGSPFGHWTLVLTTSFVGILSAYVLKLRLNLVAGIVGFKTWWVMQAMSWVEKYDISSSPVIVGMFFLGLVLYGVGVMHREKLKSFAQIYLTLGGAVVGGTLFVFSTQGGLRIIEIMTSGTAIFASWQLTFVLAGYIIAAISVALYLLVENKMSVWEGMAFFFLLLLFVVILFLPEQEIFSTGPYYYRKQLSAAGVVWAVFFNIITFFFLLAVVLLGYAQHNLRQINAGIAFLFLFVMVKYFDWFFRFLDKSVFFIGAGALLFVVGWFLERGRRYMVYKVTEGEHGPHISQ